MQLPPGFFVQKNEFLVFFTTYPKYGILPCRIWQSQCRQKMILRFALSKVKLSPSVSCLYGSVKPSVLKPLMGEA